MISVGQAVPVQFERTGQVRYNLWWCLQPILLIDNSHMTLPIVFGEAISHGQTEPGSWPFSLGLKNGSKYAISGFFVTCHIPFIGNRKA